MRSVLPLLLLSACQPDEQITYFQELVELDLAWMGPAVLDPKLSGDPALGLELSVAVAPEGEACDLQLSATHRDGRVCAWVHADPIVQGDTLTVSWDGRDAEGLAFDPGVVQLVATVACEGGARASAALRGWIVRLGVVEVDLDEQPDDGGFVPLAFHKLDLVTPGVTELDGLVPEWRSYPGDSALADLDDVFGEPRVAPEPWGDPDVPPWGAGSLDDSSHALPAAYAAGVRARLGVRVGSDAVSQYSGAVISPLGVLVTAEDAPPVLRLRADGLDAEDSDAAYAVGGTYAFDSAALPSTLGRQQLDARWTFQALGDDGWEDLAGWQDTTHEVWTTAGASALRDGTNLGFAPAVSWIGVLADLEESMTGLDADDAQVLDAVREYLHHDDWLIYNPSDSAYTSYSGSYIYWNYIWVDLGEWLDRDDGIELYCHSVSCMLSTLAGHWGVNAPQQVLGVGFTTNLARAAGTEGWARYGFNSHSVVSPDDGATIWDASVDLDGDDDPYNEPVEPVSPMGMDGEEYLWRLTYDDIGIVNSGLCYFE